MRKSYSLFLLLSIFAFSLSAQVNRPATKGAIYNPYSQLKNSVLNKAINCIDSVRYPQSKLSGVPETGPLTNNTAAQTGISQAFHYTGTGSIHGIGAYLLLDFDGIAGNFASVTAKIRVYNIGAQNYPTTPIDSATVQVADVGFNEQVLMFSSPIAVSDSFAIAIEMGTFNATTDTIWYTTNICGWNGSICTVGDGNNENLSCVLSPDFVSANGSNWFNNNLEVFGWNIDFLMHPIIEDTIVSSYTSDKDTVCPNETVVFTNTSMNNTDAMFNLFNTTTNPLYTWDFNDGTGTYNPFDTSYAFSAPGTYNTQLSANYYGYTLNCMDVNSMPIVVHDTAIANFGFTHQGGGVYQFSDSSSNANTFSWNFGDGSPVDNSQNPSHTYTASNNYSVCLTVTDTNGCNVHSVCKTLPFTLSIDDVKSPQVVNVYPIPANKYFNVDVPTSYFGGNIIITDVVGKTLKQVAIESQEKVKVLTTDIASGIYFVSVDYSGERVYTKRIVIDK